MVPEQDDLYALKVRGTSMIDAMVNDGDIVVMKKQAVARDGDMVAVRLLDRDEMTLKHFYRESAAFDCSLPTHPAAHLHLRQLRDSRPRGGRYQASSLAFGSVPCGYRMERAAVNWEHHYAATRTGYAGGSDRMLLQDHRLRRA